MESKARIAGILSIVAGGLGVLGGASIALLGSRFIKDMYLTMPFGRYQGHTPDYVNVLLMVYLIQGSIGVQLGALGIVGGVFSVRRKRWPLALAAAIAGCITFFPCSIPAVIFTSMSKPEFSAGAPPASSSTTN